jgi:hypothetical protein
MPKEGARTAPPSTCKSSSWRRAKGPSALDQECSRRQPQRPRRKSGNERNQIARVSRRILGQRPVGCQHELRRDHEQGRISVASTTGAWPSAIPNAMSARHRKLLVILNAMVKTRTQWNPNAHAKAVSITPGDPSAGALHIPGGAAT